MSDAILDMGAFIAFERSQRRVVAIVARAPGRSQRLFITADREADKT